MKIEIHPNDTAKLVKDGYLYLADLRLNAVGKKRLIHKVGRQWLHAQGQDKIDLKRVKLDLSVTGISPTTSNTYNKDAKMVYVASEKSYNLLQELRLINQDYKEFLIFLDYDMCMKVCPNTSHSHNRFMESETLLFTKIAIEEIYERVSKTYHSYLEGFQ